MKTFVARFVIAIGIFGAAHAARADFGIRGGYGLSSPAISFDGVGTRTSVTREGGYLIGLTNTHELGPFAFEIDVLYAKRVFGIEGTGTSSFNYVEAPLLGTLTLGFVRLGGGAYYALSVGKIRSCLDGACASTDYDEVSFRKGDYGLIGMVGFTIPTPGVGLHFDVRYRHGMMNLTAIDGASIKWRGVDLIAGIVF